VGLVKARDRDPDATTALDETLASVDATEDQVSQAVVRLAHASVLTAMGAPGAASISEAAESRLHDLGIAAQGWRTIFRLALTPAPATV